VPVIALTRVTGRELGSIYVQKGVLGKWLVFAIGVLVTVYLLIATNSLRPTALFNA